MISQPIDNGSRVKQQKNKGTSKRHKMDEKSTHFPVHVPPSIYEIQKNTTKPRTY